MIGAIFYAIVTGNVINQLDEASARNNKVGTDIVRLSSYLDTARVSRASKERIMKGYMLRNVLTENGPEIKTSSGGSLLDLDDEVLGTLPHYLRMEVGIYARAEMIHRKSKFFLHCSKGFLVALSTSLSRARTLLPGDYLMKKDEPKTPEFIVVESGSLQVLRGNHTVNTLGRGDCIGKAWLLQMKKDFSSIGSGCYAHVEGEAELQFDKSTVSIRALSPCVLVTGLSTVKEIHNLERGYRIDFRMLRAEAKGQHVDETARKEKAMRGIAKAVRRFKERRRMAALTQAKGSEQEVDRTAAQ